MGGMGCVCSWHEAWGSLHGQESQGCCQEEGAGNKVEKQVQPVRARQDFQPILTIPREIISATGHALLSG